MWDTLVAMQFEQQVLRFSSITACANGRSSAKTFVGFTSVDAAEAGSASVSALLKTLFDYYSSFQPLSLRFCLSGRLIICDPSENSYLSN